MSRSAISFLKIASALLIGVAIGVTGTSMVLGSRNAVLEPEKFSNSVDAHTAEGLLDEMAGIAQSKSFSAFEYVLQDQNGHFHSPERKLALIDAFEDVSAHLRSVSVSLTLTAADDRSADVRHAAMSFLDSWRTSLEFSASILRAAIDREADAEIRIRKQSFCDSYGELYDE